MNITKSGMIDLEHTNLAEATRKSYKVHLRQFYSFAQVDGIGGLIKMGQDELHTALVEYSKYLREEVDGKRLSANSIPIKFSAIKYMLDINGRENDVRWKSIKVLWPKPEKKSGYKPYTNEILKQLLSHTGSPRNTAVIHFMASTGCRIGVHDHPLLVRHLKKMSSTDDPQNMDCYSVLLYADETMTLEEKDARDKSRDGEDDEYSYYGFLTPEATRALDEYIEFRKKRGDVVTAESPIFRSENKRDKINDQLSGTSIRFVLDYLLKKSNSSRSKSGHRYDMQIAHGMRKRFNTILKLDGTVNSNIAEKLMAHKRGLDGVYLKPTRQECFEEFKKAIPALTLDKSSDTAYKKCNGCNTINPPNTKRCTKCGVALDVEATANDMSELERENYRLKMLVASYEKKIQEQEEINEEFRAVFRRMGK